VHVGRNLVDLGVYVVDIGDVVSRAAAIDL
jgi:hypothetical protein